MNQNKSSNGIEIINHIIKENRKQGDEIYEEEINKMNPINYLNKAKEIYKNYVFI